MSGRVASARVIPLRSKPTKQMMARSELRRLDKWWRTLNRPFELNSYFGPQTGPAWRVRVRAHPLVLSAIHAVRHHRGATGVKPADANTGGLVLAVGMYLHSGSVVLLRDDMRVGDPNYLRDHPLKDELATAISDHWSRHVLIDFHGMKDDRNYDISLGLGRYPPPRTQRLAERLAGAFELRGLTVDLGGTASGLSALSEETITTRNCTP